MTHTPGPWAVCLSSNPKNGTAWRDIVSTVGQFSPCYVGEALELDATFIVRACNAHEEMLEALRQVRSWLLSGIPENTYPLQWIDAAIAKAEGRA